MRTLFEYVEDQWIECSLWSESEWSVYKQTVRTNNDTEGWHRRLNHKAGRSNLQLYVLVDLQYQMVSEGALSRHRRAVYVDMDARIAEYWDQYDHRDITCEEFLKHVWEIYSQKV